VGQAQRFRRTRQQTIRNSSRPPSSDGPGAMPLHTRKRGNSQGAQPGHKGRKREMVEKVDNIHGYYPGKQCLCGGHM